MCLNVVAYSQGSVHAKKEATPMGAGDKKRTSVLVRVSIEKPLPWQLVQRETFNWGGSHFQRLSPLSWCDVVTCRQTRSWRSS